MSGKKPWEIRKNDRDFKVGDFLILREYAPPTSGFPGYHTGRWKKQEILFILEGGRFGIEEGYCIMTLGDVVDSCEKADL